MAKQLGLDIKAVNGSKGANLGFEVKMWTAAEACGIIIEGQDKWKTLIENACKKTDKN